MKPSEWETREMLREMNDEYSDRLTELENTFFLADPAEWIDKIEPGYRMEYFYRETGYLMDRDEPEGGEWNYDDENRESLPKDIKLPEVTVFEPDAITKMSDYCRSCEYGVSKKTGEGACPFNYLYWHSVEEQRKAFEDNGRAGFMVNMYEKKSDEDKEAIRESSVKFLGDLKRYS